MSTSMTSRQRMLAAIKREKQDHVPCCLYMAQGPWFHEPFLWYGQVERAKRMLELGLDATIDIWMPDPAAHRDVEFRTWRERKCGEAVITKEYHTPAGVLRQVVRETDDWMDPRLHQRWIPETWGFERRNHCGIELMEDWNVSRRIEPWVKGPEDLDKLRYLIRPLEGGMLDQWRMDGQRAIEIATKMDVATLARRTIVGDAFQWFCDIPWFLIQLIDNPKFVKEFYQIFQDWAMWEVQEVLKLGVDVVQYRGWYEIPTYFGKQYWQEFLLPNIKSQSKLVHDAGKTLNYLLPEGHGFFKDTLTDRSIDTLQGIDPRMLHGGNLGDLYDSVGGQKSFWGGVNTEVTLESCDPGRIEQEVVEAIEALGRNNGLILSAIIFTPEPTKGILSMIDAWKKHSKSG